MMDLVDKYKDLLGGYGHPKGETTILIKLIDFRLRRAIGKTDDINVPLCSHQAILSREFPLNFCRVCNRDLSIIGVGRYNDFIVLRHPNCRKPICVDCAKNNPDEFFLAFKRGTDKLMEDDKNGFKS